MEFLEDENESIKGVLETLVMIWLNGNRACAINKKFFLIGNPNFVFKNSIFWILFIITYLRLSLIMEIMERAS